MKTIMNFFKSEEARRKEREEGEARKKEEQAKKEEFIERMLKPLSKEELEKSADKIINESLYDRLCIINKKQGNLRLDLADGYLTKQEYIKKVMELRKGLELPNTKNKEE